MAFATCPFKKSYISSSSFTSRFSILFKMTIHRRPSRPSLSRARSLVSTLSLAFIALVSILALCPVSVKADEDKRSEYGTVIGIGKSTASILYMNAHSNGLGSDLGTTYVTALHWLSLAQLTFFSNGLVILV